MLWGGGDLLPSKLDFIWVKGHNYTVFYWFLFIYNFLSRFSSK